MDKNVTKYQIVKEDIENRIDSGMWSENQIIPSESSLCDEFSVSRITVRRALDELVQEGRLYRIKGKGCFVAESGTGKKLLPIYSFTEVVQQHGRIPSKRVISMEKTGADRELAEKFGIAEGAVLYRLESVYEADGVPYCLNVTYMPEELFPKLDFFNFSDHSLYQVLRSFYKVEFSRVEQEMEAVTADERTYRLLECESGKPVLEINAAARGIFDSRERVFEVYKALMITDSIRYRVDKANI